MGLHTPPLWLQAGSYSALEDRQLMSGLLHSRGGVTLPTGFQVTQTGTASMAVVISSGRAFIPGSTVTNQGMYSAWSDGNDTRTINAANATNPRIDIVVLTIRDAAVTGANNDVILQVIAGTPSGSPVQPTTPNDSLLLATVLVGASVTSITNANIANLAPRMSLIGGVLPVASQTERDALVLYDGLRVWRLDLHNVETYTNGAWRPAGLSLPASGLLHQPRRLLTRTATGAIADSTLTAIGGWTSQAGDDGDTTGLVFNTNKITVTYPGLYRITYAMFFTSSAAGGRFIHLYKNATLSGSIITGGTLVGYHQQSAGTAGGVSGLLSIEILLAATDTITPGAQQTSGGSLSVGSATANIVFWHMVRVDDQ